MKKLVVIGFGIVALSGCAGKPLLSDNTRVPTGIYDCSNAKTGLRDTLTVSPGKIYVGSVGMSLREVQAVKMNDGKPLVKYQGDFAVWYSNPQPILTNMKDARYRLACVKKA